MKKQLVFIFLALTLTLSTNAQDYTEDAAFIQQIHDKALTDAEGYKWLSYLTKNIGARLAGSPQAAAAVEYTRQIMDTLQFDEVRLQECQVPHWVRGRKEQVRIIGSSRGDIDLHALSLGNTIGTGNGGLTAEVVSVNSLDEVDELGVAGIKGKIVLYNRPMEATLLNTFRAYGKAVDQRVHGASRASKYGAVATLVRSMSSYTDHIPHTGVQRYQDDIPPIPALAIGTKDADLITELLEKEKVRVHIFADGRMLKNEISYNVIGEIKGSEKPEEIILVGGHLDSWDVGEGAHDDGAGCVQSMEAIRFLTELGYQPKRTIRVVLFMNEENGLMGGKKYWEISNKNKEFHLASIESDRGAFTPRGFTTAAHKDVFDKYAASMQKWQELFSPYGLLLEKGGGAGADISGLKSQKGLLIGYKPDSQRYFSLHHTSEDVLEAVNERELHLGTAAIASLIYMIDKYGL